MTLSTLLGSIELGLIFLQYYPLGLFIAFRIWIYGSDWPDGSLLQDLHTILIGAVCS